MKPWIRCFYYKDHQWRWWPPFRGSPTTFLDTLGMTTIEVGNVGFEADVSSEEAGAVEAAISGDNGQSLWLEARGCWEPFNSSLLSLFLQRSALASLLRRLLWGPGGAGGRNDGASSLMLYSRGRRPRNWRTTSMECLRRFFQEVKLWSEAWLQVLDDDQWPESWAVLALFSSAEMSSQWSKRPSLWQSLEDERKWLEVQHLNAHAAIVKITIRRIHPMIK